MSLSKRSLLEAILSEVQAMSQVVDQLVAQVAAQRTVVDSIDTLVAQLFTTLQGAVDTGDVNKVQQALDDLKAQAADMTSAVTANTPQQPTPQPGPQSAPAPQPAPPQAQATQTQSRAGKKP